MLRLDLASAKHLDAEGTHVVTELDATFDALFERCRRLRPVIGWRDARHLTWRYLAHPTNAYTIVTAPTGYAVSKRIGEDLDIVDLLVDDEDAGAMRALLGGVLAASPGARAVNLWMPLAGPLHLELERIGFAPGAPTTYLGVRALAPLAVDLGDVRELVLHHGRLGRLLTRRRPLRHRLARRVRHPALGHRCGRRDGRPARLGRRHRRAPRAHVWPHRGPHRGRRCRHRRAPGDAAQRRLAVGPCEVGGHPAVRAG